MHLSLTIALPALLVADHASYFAARACSRDIFRRVSSFRQFPIGYGTTYSILWELNPSDRQIFHRYARLSRLRLARSRPNLHHSWISNSHCCRVTYILSNRSWGQFSLTTPNITI